MTYGWNTHKTNSGYSWAITRTVFDEASGHGQTTIIKSGFRTTYARAMHQAKRWCLYFRKGGVA